VSGDPDVVRRSRRVVLPGVGSFEAGMEALRENGLDTAIAERVREARPLLGVCLGMQLLGRASDESPGVSGLGIVPHAAHRFRGPVRVPQLGWNLVEPDAESRFVEPGFAYFANSYRWDMPETAIADGWTFAATDHGGRFASAAERGPVLACQFHPGLSGAWGARLLSRWLDETC
jgi:imidazole glycerol phosphate synthase glutamine amidotransferase subunit